MFSKKILGLVGLLFIGSQVSADIIECVDRVKNANVVEGCLVEDSYCRVGKEIYNFGSIVVEQIEEDCKVKVTDEVLFFNENGRKVDLSNINITEGDAELKMYYCNGISCAATKGYVKNTNGDFLIKSGKALLASPVTVDSATTCTGNVGKLVSVTVSGDTPRKDIYLCLTENKSVQLNDVSAEGSYLVSSSPSDDLNLDAADNTKYVITKEANILLVNILYTTGNEPHCYDDSDASIMPRIENYCEKENCNEYYVCNAGECTLQMNVCPGGTPNTNPRPTCDPTESTNCDEGYYLHSEGLIVTDGNEGILYHCEQKEVVEGAKKRTDAERSIECTQVTPIPTGYFKNTAYNSADESHNAQYIECNAKTCKAITVTETTCKDGLVYKDDGGNIHLCLDSNNSDKGSSISIELTDNEVNGNYFIKVNRVSSVFYIADGIENKYTIVTVNSGSVYTTDAAIDNKLFRYAGDNYKVLTKPITNTPQIRTEQSVCASVNDLYEFGNICEGSTGTGLYEYKDYRNRRPKDQSN